MKKALSFLLVFASLLTLLPACAKEETEEREINGKKYVLTFVDEFEGNKLDKKKWELCPEWQRQDLGGYWDDDMVSLRDGNLVLTASIREDGTPISGAVRSRGKFAFWLMDSDMKNEPGNGAADGAEIDIMESFDIYSGRINHAIHWDGYNEYHKSTGHEVQDPSLYEGFHLFALEWTDTEYIFFVDGKETWRTSSPGMCENALYLKLTTEFGNWAAPLIKEQYPDEFLVDYVRVYKLAE